LAFIEKWP